MHRQAREMRIKVLGLEHPDTLTIMSHLAVTLDMQGKHIEAGLVKLESKICPESMSSATSKIWLLL